MSNKVYAVESYNSDSNTYHRYEVGTESNMKQLLNDLVSKDVSNGIENNYYRIASVSEQDNEDWDRQVKYLPDVKNTDKVFGEWIQIGTASKYLDVTFGRVFHLVTAGQLSVKEVGRNKLVSVHDVVDRKINNPKAGRPSSTK